MRQIELSGEGPADSCEARWNLRERQSSTHRRFEHRSRWDRLVQPVARLHRTPKTPKQLAPAISCAAYPRSPAKFARRLEWRQSANSSLMRLTCGMPASCALADPSTPRPHRPARLQKNLFNPSPTARILPPSPPQEGSWYPVRTDAAAMRLSVKHQRSSACRKLCAAIRIKRVQGARRMCGGSGPGRARHAGLPLGASLRQPRWR